MKLPSRKNNSHKGENGKVLMIGGNEVFHGAPILASLGAEKSGVDLIFLMLPKKHVLPATVTSQNIIVRTFVGDHFTEEDIGSIDFCPHEPNVLLIGNGLGKKQKTKQAVLKLLSEMKIPVVLDADALIPEILDIKMISSWIITPHDGEFERIFGLDATAKNVQKMAKKYSLMILKKGAVDFIAGPDGNFTENKTGTPHMSVGGTGDALAGIVSGFLAQGLSPFEACESAAFLWGKCGEELAKKRFSFSAREMLERFPMTIRKQQ